MKLFVQLMTVVLTLMQLTLMGLVIAAGVYAYTNGLKALINGIWTGFGQ